MSEKPKSQRLLSWLFPILIFALAAAALLVGSRQAARAADSEALRVLEESLDRAALSCYAIEGRYPETLQYLTENYGVSIDDERFDVYYSIFASNLRPDITVVERSRP